MTKEEREEAIKQLQGCIIAEEHGKDGKPNGNVTCELTKDILDMAIKALEQEPCEDAISREDALMALTGEWTEITDEIIHRFIKRIKALPPVNPQSEWLPVSEILPEENKTVIASTDYCIYPEARYTEKCGWEGAYESGADYWVKIKDVIAWMSLPKPYVPETNIGKASEIPTGSDPQESEKVN